MFSVTGDKSHFVLLRTPSSALFYSYDLLNYTYTRLVARLQAIKNAATARLLSWSVK